MALPLSPADGSWKTGTQGDSTQPSSRPENVTPCYAQGNRRFRQSNFAASPVCAVLICRNNLHCISVQKVLIYYLSKERLYMYLEYIILYKPRGIALFSSKTQLKVKESENTDSVNIHLFWMLISRFSDDEPDDVIIVLVFDVADRSLWKFIYKKR